MPRGPLPKPQAEKARRNPPTIPTTSLPASGRSGDIPIPPAWIDLGDAGLSWWEWAWRTPQAAAWSEGDMTTIARRASIEDDLRVLNNVDALDYDEAIGTVSDDESKYAAEMKALKKLLGRLAALCSNRMAICREARELDNLLGLTPKGMAALRWKIVADKPKAVVATMARPPKVKRPAD